MDNPNDLRVVRIVGWPEPSSFDRKLGIAFDVIDEETALPIADVQGFTLRVNINSDWGFEATLDRVDFERHAQSGKQEIEDFCFTEVVLVKSVNINY
jgi:hypothetical protein